MNNLNFEPEDHAALEGLVTRARAHAELAPCKVKEEAADPQHSFRFGPWHLSLTRDEFARPKAWHASAALMQEVGSQAVTLSTGIIGEAPQDALVTVESWNKEERDQAGFLLGKLMAPYITDEHQRVHVLDGLFALHWLTEVK